MHKVSSVPTVLAVDDEPGNLMVIDAALSPYGYEVVTVRTSAEAERFMELSKPDVILLDVVMDGESGIDVCRRWRARRSWERVPIVLFTALAAGGHRADGLSAGADDYLEKPVDPDALLRVTRRWVAIGRRGKALPLWDGRHEEALARAMRRAASPRTRP